MSDKAPLTFYKWPGGRKSVAGGTRTAIKLDRPWQKEILVNKETCPFCNKPQRDVDLVKLGEQGDWRVIENLYTPYPFHRMVIPTECWSAEEQRALGGVDRIRGAVLAAMMEISKVPEKTIFVNVHVGSLGGQNVNHIHYHIVQYKFDDSSESGVDKELHQLYDARHGYVGNLNHLVMSSNSVLQLAAGGMRSGQFFLLPTGQNPLQISKHESSSLIISWEIANALNMLITKMNTKFRSNQGIAPDYKIALLFEKGAFKYGSYVPVLNNLGGAEELALYENSCPITMPWTHEATVEYLKS